MKTTDEALDWAISHEIQSKNLYEHWAGIARDIDAHKLFTNLAMMETHHIEVLTAAKERGFDQKRIDWVDLSKGVAGYPTTGLSGLKQILEYAIKKEVAAERRYRDMAKKLPEISKAFTELAEEERSHQVLLRDQYKRILTPH